MQDYVSPGAEQISFCFCTPSLNCLMVERPLPLYIINTDGLQYFLFRILKSNQVLNLLTQLSLFLFKTCFILVNLDVGAFLVN